METKIHKKMLLTNDSLIRIALRDVLDKELGKYRNKGHKAEIFEELGIRHGTTRIDLAIVNGVMCGYEIKSDKDTLKRLPEQVEEFNTVFDELTLVVGKRHLYNAMHIIPDWWGVMVAKIDSDNKVFFQTIREAEKNHDQIDKVSIAKLLWREEALQILETKNKAKGLRSKPRKFIYKKLADTLDPKALKECVSSQLLSREDWRAGAPLVLNGG